jgi:hypothetical protein
MRMDDSWSPWDLTPSGMGVVIAVALIIAMIVAQWSKHGHPLVETSPVHVDTSGAGSAAPAMPLGPSPVASARSATPNVAATPAEIAECNRYAANRIGYRGPHGLDDLDETGKSDELYRRAYASCMRSRGYAG